MLYIKCDSKMKSLPWPSDIPFSRWRLPLRMRESIHSGLKSHWKLSPMAEDGKRQRQANFCLWKDSSAWDHSSPAHSGICKARASEVPGNQVLTSMLGRLMKKKLKHMSETLIRVYSNIVKKHASNNNPSHFHWVVIQTVHQAWESLLDNANGSFDDASCFDIAWNILPDAVAVMHKGVKR